MSKFKEKTTPLSGKNIRTIRKPSSGRSGICPLCSGQVWQSVAKEQPRGKLRAVWDWLKGSGLDIVAVVISVAACYVSYASSHQTNNLYEVQLEMQINGAVAAAKESFYEEYPKLLPLPPDERTANAAGRLKLEKFDVLFDGVANAYEAACTLYDDGVVDKDRFRKTHKEALRLWIEAGYAGDKYNRADTRYRSTIKVYDEWMK